jgi:hypothetical protein
MTSPRPTDPKLYTQIKKQLYQKYPRHSAYRSGHVVRAYKSAFRQRYGARRSPYRGKSSRRQGLVRWFAEEWRNPREQVGYQYKSDVYRPTRRVSPQTPVTFRELSPRRLASARRTKARTGRVRRF